VVGIPSAGQLELSPSPELCIHSHTYYAQAKILFGPGFNNKKIFILITRLNLGCLCGAAVRHRTRDRNFERPLVRPDRVAEIGARH